MATLSTPRSIKPLGNQASKSLVIPIKGEVIQLSGENKKKQNPSENHMTHWEITEASEYPFIFLRKPITALDE